MTTTPTHERDAYGRPTKVVRDGGRIVTRMLAMDSVDAVLDRELRDERRAIFDARRFNDQVLHKPGFRTASVPADATHMAHDIARDRIAAAYAARDAADASEWENARPSRTSEEQLASAKRVAEEDPAREGRADPRTARSKKYRKKQSARPFQHEASPNEDDSYEATPDSGVPDDGRAGGDEIDQIVEATQNSGVERRNRPDVPDSLDALRARHAEVLDAAYRRYDDELDLEWTERRWRISCAPPLIMKLDIASRRTFRVVWSSKPPCIAGAMVPLAFSNDHRRRSLSWYRSRDRWPSESSPAALTMTMSIGSTEGAYRGWRQRRATILRSALAARKDAPITSRP